MRFFLFVFLWGLTSAAFATTAPNSTPVNSAPIIANTQNSQDLMYQQLFSMQSQLVRLDEKLQQQKSLGNDFKTLEAAQQALKAQLANLQTKLETQEKLQTNQMSGIDGRISDIASNTNIWGSIFTLFGLIITVAAVGLGFNAKNRAVYEAKQAANTASESHMEKWLLDNKGKLISETKVELEKVSLELKERAEKLEAEARAALEKIKQEQQQAWDALLAENKDVVTSKRNKEDNTATKHNKPKVYQTAQEWFKAGINAFANSEYDEALNAWNKVLGLVDSEQEPMLYAITMINQGITYGRQDKLENALRSYATLIEQFKDSSNEELQIEVAKAMTNQGVIYGQQGKLDDALSSFATLIEQFKGSSSEEIQIQVARAMYNQGIAYGQQGKPDEELSSYATLIEQFKGSSNEEIQIQVAKAMINQGIAYGQQGKLDNEIRSYATLIEQFKGSANEEVQIQVAEAMCSQSAVYGLNKDFLTALKSHSMLLEAFHNSENSEIKKIIANSKANIAEQALLYETPEQVLIRVAEAEKYSENPQLLAVMQFIRFLLDDKTIEEVFTALTKIPTEMELKWAFREINDYLTDNFEGIKQQQIQAVVQYFEQHKDIEKLRVELGIKG
ncbi:hypothetical protein PUND_a3410 [Pseudoalteromonas undina]|nr:tetratricopeptide repeat protein [Pseudoalteromonas undina]KAF7767434.1 hypothetical protein PUND_a3410 [Pseudoalteromonas undina]